MQKLDPGLLGAGAGRATPQCCDIVPRLGEAACGGLSGWGAASARGQQDVLSPSQVTGRAALQSTTLQSLGITGGSAIIRWGVFLSVV